MPKRIKIVLQKMAKQDSTAILNSLLQESASSPKMTDEEKAIAGFLALIDGPVKVSYGLLMIAGGIILAPIPCVVANVSTSGYSSALSHVDMTGTERIEVTGIGLNFRTPKSPFHYREEIYSRGYRVITNGKQFGANINIQDKYGMQPERIPENYRFFRAKTTITGFNLATTGLGRVITGTFDPIVGPIMGRRFAEKALIRSREESVEIGARRAPSARR
jgi:hypothetical protein